MPFGSSDVAIICVAKVQGNTLWVVALSVSKLTQPQDPCDNGLAHAGTQQVYSDQPRPHDFLKDRLHLLPSPSLLSPLLANENQRAFKEQGLLGSW